jgi:amino acid transporter
MSVGWIVVSFFTIFIAISMAEIVSAIPTAGGPYYWAAILAPAKHSAFASWVTGWFVSPHLNYLFPESASPGKEADETGIGSTSWARWL